MNYEIHRKVLRALTPYIKELDAEIRFLAKLFVILTDHMNQKYFLMTKRLKERQKRWE